MEKKTIFALIAVLVLGGAAVLLWNQSENENKPKKKINPMAAIQVDKIATLQITQPGGKDSVTLTKLKEIWQVTAPYQKPADQNLVKNAVNALEKIKWGDVISENKEMFSELEISQDKAIHVIAKDSSGGLIANLYLGKSTTSETMVRIEGKEQVYQVTDLNASAFKKEGKVWRDHSIFSFKVEDAEKLTLKKAGTTVTLEKIVDQKESGNDKKPGMLPGGSDTKWKIVDSSDRELKSQKPESIDHRLVNLLIQTVATLRADDFQDDISIEKAGLLGDGILQIEVGFAQGKSAQLRLGSQQGDAFYAQNVEVAQVFTLPKYKADSLNHAPQDMKDKTVLSLKEKDIEQVTIETVSMEKQPIEKQAKEEGTKLVLKQVENKWQVEGVEQIDEVRVKGFLGSLERLVGEQFVEPTDLALLTLEKPIVIVTIKPKTGSEIVLKMSELPVSSADEKKTKEGINPSGVPSMGVPMASVPSRSIIKRDDQPPVWVPKYQVDLFRKKPSDFQKSAEPASINPMMRGPGPRLMPGPMPMPR